MSDDRIERVFKLTAQDGEPFFAAVVRNGDGLAVVSTRGGKWAPEPEIGVADLEKNRVGDLEVEEVRDPAARPIREWEDETLDQALAAFGGPRGKMIAGL